MFWKVFSEPVYSSPDNVICLEPLSTNDGIINTGRVSRHRSFFPTESICNSDFLVLVYRTIEGHHHSLAMPFYFCLFWFFKHIIPFYIHPTKSQLTCQRCLELGACSFYTFYFRIILKWPSAMMENLKCNIHFR